MLTFLGFILFLLAEIIFPAFLKELKLLDLLKLAAALRMRSLK